MPLLKPIPPDFPKLPDKLRQIIGPDASRNFEKAMEAWRIENAIALERYVKETAKVLTIDDLLTKEAKAKLLAALFTTDNISNAFISAYSQGGNLADFLNSLLCTHACPTATLGFSLWRAELPCIEHITPRVLLL